MAFLFDHEISLGGGNPDPSTFPIDKMQFSLKDGTVLQVSSTEMQQALQYSPTVRFD